MIRRPTRVPSQFPPLSSRPRSPSASPPSKLARFLPKPYRDWRYFSPLPRARAPFPPKAEISISREEPAVPRPPRIARENDERATRPRGGAPWGEQENEDGGGGGGEGGGHWGLGVLERRSWQRGLRPVENHRSLRLRLLHQPPRPVCVSLVQVRVSPAVGFLASRFGSSAAGSLTLDLTRFLVFTSSCFVCVGNFGSKGGARS